MISTTLIVPGVGGSGAEHWQTWFEHRIEGSMRVEQDDWEKPVLHFWAGNIRRAIDLGRGPLWIVAHSFGCLAAVAAAQGRQERIAGAMLVAPADPDRFTPDGLRDNGEAIFVKSITPLLPERRLGFPTILIASENDPWAGLMASACLAGRWGSRFLNIGAAGHINVDAGFGAWPHGIALLEELRQPRAACRSRPSRTRRRVVEPERAPGAPGNRTGATTVSVQSRNIGRHSEGFSRRILAGAMAS